MTRVKRFVAATALALISAVAAYAEGITGIVLDKKDRQPLIGATVQVAGTGVKAITDIDGKFSLNGLKAGKYSITVNYISYKTVTLDGVEALKDTEGHALTIEMETDEQTLGEVSVVGIMKQNTDVAMLQVARKSQLVVSNVSAQEIKRTQDSNAGEVIRRVPGVSIIDEKFVMVRGLSQRYNNVWINGGAVPSSEADSRAFSFDIIPSAQIDNMQIIKTPAAEFPADYSGGFITINTKDIPTENIAEIQVGGNWNDATAFSSFRHAKGSGTDFLGFDNGMRGLSGGINAVLNPIAGNGTDLLNNGLNNDWRIRESHPLGDLKLSANIGRRWRWAGRQMGLIAALNYSNEYRKYEDMTNNLFGVYNTEDDRSNYLRRSTDDQYNRNVRLGAMLNMTLLSADGNSKYQFKNIFNQLGNDRYTWREGVSAQSDTEHSAEYYYRSRTTYNGQLTGKHTFRNDELDWSASYSYANRNVPDRRRYLVNDALETGVIQLTNSNDISREWTKLDEHIASAAVNNRHSFKFGSWEPVLKFGAYGEYRTRKYTTRDFIYNWNAADNTLPDGFRQNDLSEMLSDESYFGADRLYLMEEQHMRNNYKGNNTQGAGYIAATIPAGRLSILAGLRYEYNHMELITNTRDYEESPFSHNYEYSDLFPSLNTTYKINDKHQVRFSYGKTVNRPEFREVSPSVFYDFDLASNVEGNTELKPCYIQNVDLRYEFYPSKGEVISLAAFYKHFDSPIEWTYTVAGGTNLIYSYMNAKSAKSYGLELDIRKDLSFIGLPGFSWSFNGALIKSRVNFEKGSREEDRPMQGQSPYLINTGIFYNNDKLQLSVAALYNRIGKRIIGVGRSEGTTSDNEALRVPDSYEMPRDVIDLSVSKMFGSHWEVKFNVRDLLAQTVYYKQFADVHYQDGSRKEVQQITRAFKPGRNFGLSAVYKF